MRDLEQLDLSGYARQRSLIHPELARGASYLSPHIRHGLLSLEDVWARAEPFPTRDAYRFRTQLLWQEYARQWYAVLGAATGGDLIRTAPQPKSDWNRPPWDRDLKCLDQVVGELLETGAVPNQARMWLAGQWVSRAGKDWRDGEDKLFAALIDGSRAANRLGWHWCAGTLGTRPYGFSRWQVTRRAPEYCESCGLKDACPIEAFPRVSSGTRSQARPTPSGPGFGPLRSSPRGRGVDTIWLTAESLGSDDPALSRFPDAPVAFIFEKALLAQLQLRAPRLVYIVQRLAELAESRDLSIHLGDPRSVLRNRDIAVTWTPVPGFVRHLSALKTASNRVVLSPWPWLCPPHRTPLGDLDLSGIAFPTFKEWRALTHSTAGKAGPQTL